MCTRYTQNIQHTSAEVFIDFYPIMQRIKTSLIACGDDGRDLPWVRKTGKGRRVLQPCVVKKVGKVNSLVVSLNRLEH